MTQCSREVQGKDGFFHQCTRKAKYTVALHAKSVLVCHQHALGYPPRSLTPISSQSDSKPPHAGD